MYKLQQKDFGAALSVTFQKSAERQVLLKFLHACEKNGGNAKTMAFSLQGTIIETLSQN